MNDTHLHDNPPVTDITERGFSYKRNGVFYGLVAGGLMSLYLLLLNVFTAEYSIGLNMLKHVIMIPIMGMAVNRYKKALPEGKIFKDGLLMGLVISAVAAATVLFANIIFSAVGPALSFEQFTNEGDGTGDVLINGLFMAMEIFVFGMIIIFAWLQLKKDGKPADG